uniref:Uncharacterized protein n=1 Tax=Oryza glumipatula TaxID=40148 RepID=A0A0D9ZK19_9ORYZ
MVWPAHDDSLPLAALEVTACLVRRAAPKRRVAELDVEAQQASGGRRGECRRRGGGVLGVGGVQVLTEEHRGGGVLDADGCVVPDSEDEESGGGVHNLEQKPDKDISANLEEQHMDGIEQLVGGEEVAGLQDDAGVAARDEGVDEFAEIRERNLFARLLHNCFPR